MCCNMPSDAMRRRQYQVITPPSSIADQHVDVAAFLNYSDDDSDGGKDVDDRRRGLFHSSSSRLTIALATLALFVITLVSSRASASFRTTSTALKELSDQVVALTRQLNTDSEVLREFHDVEHELENSKIELSWDHQHIEELEKTEEEMIYSFQMAHESEEKTINHFQKKTNAMENRANLVTTQLEYEVIANLELKAALKAALSDMAEIRKNHPPAPREIEAHKPSATVVGDNTLAEQTGSIMGPDRKLRGATSGHSYQPGDSIEIFVTHDGPTTLHPGLVSDVIKSPPGVKDAGGPEFYYNIVKLESGVIIQHVYDYQFRSYQIYPPGTKATFMQKRGIYKTVTIVGYKDDAPPGFEVHGNYQVTFDGDSLEEPRYAQALRIHRDMPADDPLNDGDTGVFEQR